MIRLLLVFILFFNFIYASSLESLLEEYEDSSKNSLKTLNEKMGHVVIYTQEELSLMQYENLSDVLKELPISNLNKNRYGMNTLSISGTKTQVSGFYRLYINDHEVSSVHTQSPFLNWLELPINIVDHIEIYYGEGSFTLGNETGIQFIRVYTKTADKENGNEMKISTSNNSSNSQSFTHSTLLENGWSYLLFFNNQNRLAKSTYKSQKINNNTNQQYFFMNLNNTNNNIDIAYTTFKKNSYMGMSTDLNPNDGELISDNFFIHVNNYFLEDKSLKTSFSVDVSNREYNEKNDQGIFSIPVLDLSNIGMTMPKEFDEDIRLIKLNAYVSKNFETKSNTLFTALNVKNKIYKTQSRNTINFLNTNTEVNQYHNYDEESIYSMMLQDNYKINDKLQVIGNLKVDRYERDGSVLDDKTESLYRVGAIYLPNDSLGFKTFFTKSYIPPSFHNIDFADKSDIEIETQEYKYFTLEGAYVYNNSRFNLEYYNVHIDDFVYFSPIGFINVPDRIKTSGLVFDYDYEINENNKIKFNYYLSKLNQTVNNSDKGGFFKFMGTYQRFNYFASLIYRNSYNYLTTHVDDSYNLNLGLTYNFTKDLSLSIKGNNLLEKPTKSIVTDVSNGFANQENTAFDDFDRSVTFSLRWLF